MALEFNLERNDLAICTACEMMINDGMTGCIAYSEGILESLEEKLADAALAQLVRSAYEVQHDLHYELSDEETISRLAQFIVSSQNDYTATEDTILNATAIEGILETVFFYKRPIIASIQLSMFEGVEQDVATRYAWQFIADVCTSYFEYLEPIELAIANR